MGGGWVSFSNKDRQIVKVERFKNFNIQSGLARKESREHEKKVVAELNLEVEPKKTKSDDPTTAKMDDSNA